MSKTKRVNFNLIQQTVYTREPQLLTGVKKTQPQKKYFELKQFTDKTGYHEELVEVDYPITRDYVKSFESSANYKNDIPKAINSPQTGTYQDLTAVQDLLNMDTFALQQKLENIRKLQAQVKAQAQAQTPKKEEEKGENK